MTVESKWWSKTTHLMTAVNQKGQEKGPKTRFTFPGHVPVTYFLQLGPSPYFALLPSDVFKVRIHQWIDPLTRSEPSWFSHFPKVHQLTTKPVIHKPLGDIADSNPNSQ
jgi:hypothetical protein